MTRLHRRLRPLRTTTASEQAGCGDVWINGDYGADLTVAADNDIVINGNIERGRTKACCSA